MLYSRGRGMVDGGGVVDGGSVVHRGGCVVGSRLMGSRVSLAVSARKILPIDVLTSSERLRESSASNCVLLSD